MKTQESYKCKEQVCFQKQWVRKQDLTMTSKDQRERKLPNKKNKRKNKQKTNA